MTFVEMRTEAEILYEAINSSAAPGFEDSEWAVIFTASQRRIVKQILEEGILKNAFNRLAIEILIQTVTYNTWEASDYFLNTDGTTAFTLNDTFDATLFWILDEYITTATLTRVPLKTITFEEYQSNLNNPFRKPVLDQVEGFWVINKENVPTIITDGTTPVNYKLLGVEHPDNNPIASGTDCVLNESVHSIIVMDAVKLAHMAVLDPNGYQLAVAADSL